jgi:hypothetical protein
MIMNEETIIDPRPGMKGQQMNKQESGAWKHVTLGGVSGILMGAGLMYAGQTMASTKNDVEVIEAPETAEESTTEAEATGNEQTTATEAPAAAESTPAAAQADVTMAASGVQVADVNQNQSFGQAFAEARAEVGPGGVFYWHGGIYNTYTAEEWNAMSAGQKNDFAQRVQPEVKAHDVPTPTDAHPDVAVQTGSEDVHVASQHDSASTGDDDVHIVGYGEIEGHKAVAVDVNNDGDADVAIIDINDNDQLDGNDVIMNREGDAARIGDVIDADTNQYAAEDPGVDPGTTDGYEDMMMDV